MNEVLRKIYTYRRESAQLDNLEESITKIKNKQEKLIPKNEEQTEQLMERITERAEYFVKKLNGAYENIKEKRFSIINLKKQFGDKDWNEYTEFCKDLGVARPSKINYRMNLFSKNSLNTNKKGLVSIAAGALLTGISSYRISNISPDHSMNLLEFAATIMSPGAGCTMMAIPLLPTKPKIENHTKYIVEKINELNETYKQIYFSK